MPRILSRTRLESLISEFNLYAEERRTELMEDVIEHMNRDINVQRRARERVSGRLRSRRIA